MKKFLLFFALFLIFGCETLREKSNITSTLSCPKVFFSLENSVYSNGELDSLNLEKIDYKATLNNYKFLDKCFSDNIYNNYNLDILILVEPINPRNKEIEMPIFVITYDSQDNIIDKHYFKVKDNLSYDSGSSNYVLTDVITKLNILVNKDNKVSSMTIGFVKIK